ncbi:MAG TPA: hypothetical protein VH374_09685 [Polyangia bacterium]|nr:hypothetical protein [Polyangia bacterium]
MTQSILPFQVDYARHPAFAPHLTWDNRKDASIDEAIDLLNRLLLDCESSLTLKRLTLAQALERVNEGVQLLMQLLVQANKATGALFAPFVDRFYLEIVRIVVDDLAYFERRNSYVPVINNAAEMALRNQLAVHGFMRFDLGADELSAIRQKVQPYLQQLQARYRQGGRSREELSTNEVDAFSTALIGEVFGRHGFNKAVSDLRHEPARAGGFAVELSPHDNDWWHSRYEDAGLTAPSPAAYFHNDESRDAYKAIIYLDDVDDQRGPFSYVPSSYAMERPRFEWVVARATLTTLASNEIRRTMTDLKPSRGVFSSRVARQFFGMLPARLRLNSHLGFDVLEGSTQAAALAAGEVKMLAPAGHVIVFDGGRLLHRGGMVRTGTRAALQVVFDVQKKNGIDFYNHLLGALRPGSGHVR